MLELVGGGAGAGGAESAGPAAGGVGGTAECPAHITS